MLVKKIFVSLMFLTSCLYYCDFSFAACTKGVKQFRPNPNDACATQERECCDSGNWSEWGAKCPLCEESTSSWVSTSENSDTCPGNDYLKEFTCDGSFVGTCTDIKAEENDNDLGQTSSFQFDPPSGYVTAYSCGEWQRKSNKKIAIPSSTEYQTYKINYATQLVQI